MAKKSKAKISFNSILLIFAMIGALIAGGTLYYYYTDTSETVDTKNINALAYAEDETFFAEINLFSNDKHNGELCFEMKFNYYTDVNIPTSEDEYKNTFSSGIQFTNAVNFNYLYTTDYYSSTTWFYEPVSAYYYNTTNNGVSYTALDELDYNDAWIVDMDGGLGLICQKDATHTSSFLWWSQNERSDIFALIKDMYEVAKSLDNGTQILQFALSDYLWVKPQMDDGTFDRSTKATDNRDWTYVNIKVNKSENGITEASQSLFNIVENNSNYSFNGITDASYWQSRCVKNLTINDFDLIENENGIYLKIKNEALDYLKVFDNLVIKVTLNLTDFQVDGFMSGCFGDLSIKYCYLTSDTEKTLTYHSEDFSNIVTITNNLTLEVV